MQRTISGTTGEVQHINYLAEHIGNLYITGECNDITLKVSLFYKVKYLHLKRLSLRQPHMLVLDIL